MKIKELLTDTSKWTKHKLARDISGKSVLPNDVNAVAWCLLGAVEKCYEGLYEQAKIDHIILRHIDEDIPVWNDKIYRSFGDVKKLVNELNI